ncbi:hypothetical protein J2W46_006642 [Paraburkholderia strydomiana]|nr:hypothetical protein [Paraburkholderia strydomiana]
MNSILFPKRGAISGNDGSPPVPERLEVAFQA